MFRWARTIAIALALTGGVSLAADAQATHVVRLEADSDKGEYAFQPATITASPGDVLVFRLVNGAPHSVVFEGKGLSAAAHRALNTAMPDRSADLSSPLLTENGAEYRMRVPALPAGTYRYFCLPHRAYDMRGEVRVN